MGPANYVLFVNKEPVGIIEAKRQEEAVKFSVHEQQVKDKSLTDLDNLPDPDVLAEEIIENLQAGIESFKEIMLNLK